MMTRALALSAILYAYLLWSIASLFQAGYFNFHDLGLINDIIGNHVFLGRLFFIPTTGENHLATHFTPSLVLLAPIYWLTSSAFVLIALNVLALAATTWMALRLAQRWLSPIMAAFPEVGGFWLVGFAVTFSVGKYFKTVAASGHFEAIATPLLLGLLVAIIHNVRPWAIVTLFLLAAGVREDVAFFAFFQMIAIFFLPRELAALTSRTKKTVVTLLVASPVIVLVASKVMIPLFGGSGDTMAGRFWGKYGASWSDVLASWLTHPLEPLSDILAHGFTRFNEAFLWLGIANPLAWLCTQLPAVLYYTSTDGDKNMLQWYNASFLLPGMIVVTLAGWWRLARWLATFKERSAWTRRVATSIAVLFVAALILVPLAQLPKVMGHGAVLRPRFGESVKNRFDQALAEASTACPDAEALALDHHAYVFAPLDRRKYLLSRYDAADLVVARSEPFTEGHASPAERELKGKLEMIADDGRYRLVYRAQGFVAYCRIP